VIPPSMAWGGRTLSAHDAMGGGEVVGGGDDALSSGWTPATGQWPTRDQAMRTPPRPPNWNVVDWADGKFTPPGAGSGSDREKKSDRDARSRPASRSRAPSRAPSRAGSGPPEIFIPDSGDEGDGWVQRNSTGSSYRGPSPLPGAGQRSQQWIYLNPNHAPNTSRPASRQRSPDPHYAIYRPPSKGKGLDDMSSTLGGALDYRSGHHRSQSHAVATSYHDYHDPNHDRKQVLRHAQASQAEKLRKKKEKDRKRTKEIEKARSSKWAPRHWATGDAPAASGSDMDDSDEESDESSDEDNDNRRTRETRNGTSNGHRNGHRHHDQLHETNGWHAHSSYVSPHAATSGGASLHPPTHFQSSASRPASRNASPSRAKKRPPPLPISSPPVIPTAALQHAAAATTNPARPGHTNGSIPGRIGAAERAQYQFEQQQRDYHQQLAKQSFQPTVKEVAHRVAEQIAAQQASAHFHAQAQAQQQSAQHAQRLRGAASWAQPYNQPVVGGGGTHNQPWYQQQQQHHHHQPQRQPQRLRPTMTEIYN